MSRVSQRSLARPIPTWSGNELAAAIVNTGRPSQIGGTTPYLTSRSGTGLVFPFGVVKTQAVAFAGQQIPAANFGFYESEDDFSGTRTIRVWNKGSGADDLRRRDLQRERVAAHAHPERGNGYGRARHVRCRST